MKRTYSDYLSASATAAISAMQDYEQTGARPKPTGSLTDAGTTPLWHSSQLNPTESAMRSTLPSSGYISSMPTLPQRPPSPATPRTHASHPMAIDNLVHPATMFTSEPSADNFMHHSGFTPVNHYKLARPLKAPLNTATYSFQTGRNMLGMTIDMNQFDSFEIERNGETTLQVDDSLTFDRDDGRVWHLGNVANESYSGTFTNDDPEDYDIKVRHLANCIREERERPERLAVAAQLLNEVRTVISTTEVISIERTSFVEEGEPVICERPGCHHQAALPADAYYVDVGGKLTFCLRCFELLWGGKFTEPPSESDPFRRDSAVAFMPADFDGPADYYRDAPRRSARLKSTSNTTQPSVTASTPSLQPDNQMFQSRWATQEDQTQCLSPTHTPNRQPKHTANNVQVADEPMEISPNSVNSNGEWYHKPTAIQHIAHRLSAGATLSDIDKAAFAVWQTTSRAQLRWDRHMLKTTMTRAYYADLSPEDEGLQLEKLDLGEEMEWEDLEAMEAKVKMRTKDCYGRDLSHVLKEAARNNGKA
ncbi:hypothetical protein M409DRAFT_21645 [Zasmidium cellare ATCC 36951]|uniref:Uncharacterized protein n=1 Tax=Zasmidium cellare ATCC 36951 TaxID=1080233 RepID=A0A6A6CMD5_ZASCE|nr:uncharacterized protein M409DRAFT_21645 [Zasmidium cellare ATCC 36951]KAF2168201.1 hypothetical protein M409DRAFT_21645 [Zasmidium cellare ATCC 36951]